MIVPIANLPNSCHGPWLKLGLKHNWASFDEADDHQGLEGPHLRRPHATRPPDDFPAHWTATSLRRRSETRRTGRTVSGEWRRWATTTRRRAKEPGSSGMPTPSSTTTPGNCFVSRYVLQRSADWAPQTVASGGPGFPATRSVSACGFSSPHGAS